MTDSHFIVTVHDPHAATDVDDQVFDCATAREAADRYDEHSGDDFDVEVGVSDLEAGEILSFTHPETGIETTAYVSCMAVAG